MQTHMRIWQYLQQHRSARVALGYGCALLALLAAFFGSGLGGGHAFAQVACTKGDQTYTVTSGDTLSGIAASYNTAWQELAAHNNIDKPNHIYLGQTVCIPNGVSKQRATTSGSKGQGNPYPYGQCTWWADHRYHELHGVYVPWVSQSNAWQWTARAREFGWHVSSRPSIGAIIDLQPWVQGAHGYGHVAVVEKILDNGNVLGSNMNWGDQPWKVVNIEFSPGPGVTFITR